MSGRKIVLIEDSKAASTVLKEVLEAEGHTVLHAADGISGLALARREKPDLILLDLLLPKLNGYEVCNALMRDSLTRHTPIVALPGDVLALLVVGRPSRLALSELLGRLLLTVARTGAEVVWIDLGHADALEPDALDLIPDLASHRGLSRRTVLVTAPDDALRQTMETRLAPHPNFVLLEHWASGLAWLEARSRAESAPP